MKIILLGDSTLQYNNCKTYPQTGWGQVLPLFFQPEVVILNFGKNGRSTKSFLKEGLFNIALKHVDPGDYVFIQFGHNDQKQVEERYTEPFTTYKDNLRKMVQDVRKRQGVPILLTSIYRRYFDDEGHILENVHGAYPMAMRELGKEEGVIVFDLCTKTKNALNILGPVKSKKYFMHLPPNEYFNFPNGLIDNTHLVYQGAFWICEQIYQCLIEENVLIDYLIK